MLDAQMPCLDGTGTDTDGKASGELMKAERLDKVRDPIKGTAMDGSKERAAMEKAGVTFWDLVPVYFSVDPYRQA